MARFFARGADPGPLDLICTLPGYDVNSPTIPTAGIALDLRIHGGGTGTLYLAGSRPANTLTNSTIVTFPHTLPYVPSSRVLMTEHELGTPPAPVINRIANYSFYSVYTFNNRIEVQDASSSWGSNFWFYYFVFLNRTS